MNITFLPVGALALGLSLTAAQAQELSLAHWVPGTHPLQVLGMEPWAESLSAATEGRFVNLLGGASVQLPAGEMRDALSRGIADITQSPWGSLFVFGADSLVFHHLDDPLHESNNACVMNRGTVDSQSPADPAHTLHAPNEAQVKMWRDAAAPLTTEWMETMRAQGHDPEAILIGLIEALQRYDSYAG